MKHKIEDEILKKAIATLRELTGLDIETLNEPQYANKQGVAGALVYLRKQNTDVKYYAEITRKVTMANYGAIVDRMGR